MKKLRCLLSCLAALASVSVFAQPAEKPAAPAPAAAPRLTKFDLDFRGGTPKELAAAIQKALGRTLNVIVPDELATWKLPPLKMNGVDVPQLFRALEQAGRSITVVATGNGSYRQQDLAYGFRTTDNSPGFQSDDTIWYFYVNSAAMPKVSRFYLLKPYLDAGLTVDDITTAIQTGWKMRGDATAPALSFHKETKLLIAVGDYAGLDIIDQVLKALDAVRAKPGPDKPADEQKTKP